MPLLSSLRALCFHRTLALLNIVHPDRPPSSSSPSPRLPLSFRKMSPNAIFNRASDVLRGNPDIARRFGNEIKTYGEDLGGRREGRRFHIPEYVYEKDSVKYVRCELRGGCVSSTCSSVLQHLCSCAIALSLRESFPVSLSLLLCRFTYFFPVRVRSCTSFASPRLLS